MTRSRWACEPSTAGRGNGSPINDSTARETTEVYTHADYAVVDEAVDEVVTADVP